MAFEPVSPITKTPQRVDVLTVTLQYSYEDDVLVKSAKFRIEVTDADGSKQDTWSRAGDLIPHLTTEQKVWLVANFMDVLWAKAAQVIPV